MSDLTPTCSLKGHVLVFTITDSIVNSFLVIAYCYYFLYETRCSIITLFNRLTKYPVPSSTDAT